MSSLRLIPPGGAPIDIQRERVLIGRDPGADVVLNDPSVSRRHAVVERRGSFWVILDQQSANGTWLNNQRVDQAALQDGQTVRLGAFSLTVAMADAAAAYRRPEPSMARPEPQAPRAAEPPPSRPEPGVARPPEPSYARPEPAGVRPGAAGMPGPALRPENPYAVTPPAPPRPPAPAAAQPGKMDQAEAAEILGLWPGSPAAEVRSRYQKMYNDFQIRLTNAPTPSLKKMYQKSITDLKLAAETLCPGVVG